MITLSNYLKSYANRTVLSIEELKIDAGLHLVTGVNGSGKTTLFKSISGIIHFKGSCTVDGINLKTNPINYRSYVNYCEAEPNFPSFLTGKELIRFVGKTKNTPDSVLDNIVELFGVTAFWTQPVSTYSSGMLKKTALVLSFTGNPKVVLLDEPFTTIDKPGKKQLCKVIKEYGSQGCTFLMSAHQEVETIPLDFDSTLVLEHNTAVKR
ncbi:MAG: ABC transporter ATP-binding protein [Bacteroidota bacterium]